MSNENGEPMSVGTAPLPLAGNLEDTAKFFHDHHRRILTAAYRITGNMADAEDVAQSVFIRLMAGRVPPANVSSYLYRAAINGALDLLRRRKAARMESLDEAVEMSMAGPGTSPEMDLFNRQLGDLLRRAISELSPRASEMFVLRFLEDMGNREIALIMGTSQAVVAVTLHNARSRLKKRIRELYEEKR